MKDGFNYQGAEINTMGGSFGRIQSSAQWGKQYDDFAVYGALEGLHDDGFRNFSPSDVRRFYGDVGYNNETNEFHLNMGVADNNFGAATTVPIELLQQYWGATYTTPQTLPTTRRLSQPDRQVEATPSWTIEGAAHVRRCSVSRRWTATRPTRSRAPIRRCLCFGNDTTPAFGLNGAQSLIPFAGCNTRTRSTAPPRDRPRLGIRGRRPTAISCSGTRTSS